MAGSDYYVVPVKVLLPLTAAERILDGVIAAGREAGLLPLTVAVLDAGGHLVAFRREDGSGILRAQIAIGKAHGALGMGIGSRVIRDRLKDRIAFQSAIAAASDGHFVPVPGGVLILDDGGSAIGAVGVSGDASDKDEYAACEGIRRASYKSHPAEPPANWREAGL